MELLKAVENALVTIMGWIKLVIDFLGDSINPSEWNIINKIISIFK